MLTGSAGVSLSRNSYGEPVAAWREMPELQVSTYQIDGEMFETYAIPRNRSST